MTRGKDRKKRVLMNLSEEELKQIDDHIENYCPWEYRAAFMRRAVIECIKREERKATVQSDPIMVK